MFSLLLKSLAFYRQKYLMTFVGLVLAMAILSGALSVGTSVRFSLQEMASRRLGQVEYMLDGRLNPMSQRLADEFSKQGLESAPVLMMLGAAVYKDRTVPDVFVNGISPSFKKFFKDAPDKVKDGEALVNQTLAQQLGLQDGDDFVLRVRNHSLLPGDLPLTGSSDEHIAMRLKVRVLRADSSLGHFSLLAGQLPTSSVFVNLQSLQSQINMKGLVNQVFFKKTSYTQIHKVLSQSWRPEDSSLLIREADNGSALELMSHRVFLPEEIVESTRAARILTYMANEISHGERTTPYSIVSGLSFDVTAGDIYKSLPKINRGEVVLNKWTATDLKAKVGSRIKIKYYVDNADGKLREDQHEFVVKAIVDPDKLDRLLMPSYPGIAEEEHCRDWEPGIPMDMTKIRDKDEDYWDEYKGTPKLIISYEDAKSLWGNRFGQTTSLRWPISFTKDAVLKSLKAQGPSQSGLNIIDIQSQARAAASQGIDFGMLFISMSFFIIVASLLMSALLLAFQLEGRQSEMGVMLAAGFRLKDVRKRFVKEGLLLATLAVIPGLGLGLFYTDRIIYFLSTIWRDAVGTSDIAMFIDSVTVIIAIVSYMLFAAFTVSRVVRNITSRSVVELLKGQKQDVPLSRFKPLTFYGGLVCAFAGIIAVFMGADSMFAVASSLLLLAVLLLTHAVLSYIRFSESLFHLSFWRLVMGNLSRNSGRSLGAFILMACGAYLVLNTVARQKSFNLNRDDKTSGIGGFEYFISTSVPLRYKPDSPEGLKEYFLEEKEITKLSVVSVRLHRGDDASCLNLNRAQNPQIYGVSPAEMEGRFKLSGKWQSLDEEQSDGTIPVIGDENTVLWGLGLYKGVGSIFPSRDEQGREVRFKVVGLLKGSILQGALIVSRAQFDRLYSAESGYSLFLVDVPNMDYDLDGHFGEMFIDFGYKVEDSVERLKNFLKIEATYLVIFQMLGGLGLILGALGFGFLILRNVQDRAGELALFQALGFNLSDLRKMLLGEHLILLIWSIFCGTACALISWAPLLRQGTELPLSRILTILGLILLVGSLSCLLSAGIVFKKNFLEILKNE